MRTRWSGKTDMQNPPEIWMNDGQGHLVDSGIRLTDPSLSSCEIGDLDDDGDMDIFIANYASGGNVVWFNQLIPGS